MTETASTRRYDASRITDDDDDDDEEEEEEVPVKLDVVKDEYEDAKPRKKRRMTQEPDKKYLCSFDGCGKLYSRAEHLNRHQLNHNPKDLYYCDQASCDRRFVRADLCARHRERHHTKGSHLQRKDAFMGTQYATASSPTLKSPPASKDMDAPPPVAYARSLPPVTSEYHIPPPLVGLPSDMHRVGTTTATTTVAPPVDRSHRTYGSAPSIMTTGSYMSASDAAVRDRRNYAFAPPHRTMSLTTSMPCHLGAMNPPPPVTPPHTSPHYFPQLACMSPSARHVSSPATYSSVPALPPFGYPTLYGPPSASTATFSSPPISSPAGFLTSAPTNAVIEHPGVYRTEQVPEGVTIPVFGPKWGLSLPYTFEEGLLSTLLNTNASTENSDPSPPAHEPTPAPTQPVHPSLPPMLSRVTPRDGWYDGRVDTMGTETVMSGHRRRRLVGYVMSFPEIERNAGRKPKGEVLCGEPDQPGHPLSPRSLHTGLAGYWERVHHQLPILHRPTFNPETCPDLLLLAMICLGGTFRDESAQAAATTATTDRCAEATFFIAQHIRWELFKEPEFRPPAKLWTFQTMLLLELFEKMLSTSALHERAHIHHVTTLVVMRRCSSLLGRGLSVDDDGGGPGPYYSSSSSSSASSAPSDPTRTPPGPEGSINTSGQNTRDADWNRWITAEATRRVAFAAFVIDSTHAKLFGHSAGMSPHDMSLPLPCDDALWTAESGSDVRRIMAAGTSSPSPPQFLDALRAVLAGRPVRTTSFGRTVLIAGLLNVGYHMQQRDQQMAFLSPPGSHRTPRQWQHALTKAFDFWLRDPVSDDDLVSPRAATAPLPPPRSRDDPVAATSHACLHALAHMSLHINITDCQVSAGVGRALGREVTPPGREKIRRQLREWAPTPQGRHAAWHARRFLAQVLTPGERRPVLQHGAPPPPPSPPSPTLEYRARDDPVFHRPWTVFYAALVVWLFGYTLDGAVAESTPVPATPEEQRCDARRFLRAMDVPDAEALEKVGGRNECVGLLGVVREGFRTSRWELLREAGETLELCGALLAPGRLRGR